MSLLRGDLAPAPEVTLSGDAARTVAALLHRELEHAEFSLEYTKNEAETHRLARIRARATASIPALESKRAKLAQAWQPFRTAGFDR